MKKITFLFLFIITGLAYGQTDIIESFDGMTQPTFVPENNNCPPTSALSMTVSTAQASTGSNSLEIITNAAGNPWQGAELLLQGDAMDLATNPNVVADVYSTVPAGILAKVTDGGDDATGAANHTGSGWETLTFDLSLASDGGSTPNGAYTNLIFYPLWSQSGGYAGQGTTPCVSTAPITIYVDNIRAVASAPDPCFNGVQDSGEEGVDCGGTCAAVCPQPPSTVPPVSPPDRNPQDVVSVYSDVYTQAPTDGFQIFGDAVRTELDYSGDNVFSFTTPLNGSGLQYQYFNTMPQFLDLSDMNTMHIDFYYEGNSLGDVDTFILVIVQTQGGTNIQKQFLANDFAPNTWHQLDELFTGFDFNAGAARDQIGQIIIQVAGTNGSLLGPVYVDNLYFYSDTVVNDTCADAIEIPFDGTPVAVGNLGATDSGAGGVCVGSPVNDVWYSFVASGTEAYFDTDAANISIYDACGGTLVSCDPTPGTAVTVVDGQTYYIRLNDEPTVTRRPTGTGYTLRASSSSLSNNSFDLNTFSIYPNPTKNTWTIEGSISTIDAIEVYDILGKRVQTLSPNAQEVTIDGTQLRTGLYLAKVYSGDAFRTIRLIKE